MIFKGVFSFPEMFSLHLAACLASLIISLVFLNKIFKIHNSKFLKKNVDDIALKPPVHHMSLIESSPPRPQCKFGILFCKYRLAVEKWLLRGRHARSTAQ